MLYKVIRIDEDVDYSCEEREKDSPVMAVVALEDEAGQRIVRRMEDRWLYANHIEEGDTLEYHFDG